MYDEAQGNGEKLPPKLDHREFTVQLVYDPIFPDRMTDHVSFVESLGDKMADTTKTVGDNSPLGGNVGSQLGDIDFTTLTGKAEYVNDTKPYNITMQRMEKNFWPFF